MAKKAKKHVSDAIVHVNASFNNTIVTFTDRQGNVLCWQTSGQSGFRGARKSTPHAATVAAELAGRKAREFGVRNITILVKGPGPGREAAIRALMNINFDADSSADSEGGQEGGSTGRGGGSHFSITEISDITGIPHNGCRPPKQRRV